MADSAIVVRDKNPALAGVLSSLICGLGQVYSGRAGRGIMLFLIMCVLITLTGAVWVFGVFDAVMGARQKNGA